MVILKIKNKIMENLNFGQALEAAKIGKKVARKGWNGSGMFSYIVPQEDCEMYDIEKKIFGEQEEFILAAHWRLKTVKGNIATWVPSNSDTLAEDWIIID